jgi:uncharacterized membrane protein YphA (DoxX/SURF4 family)
VNIDQILNDKVLCALSLLLILVWGAAKKGVIKIPKVDPETAAVTLLRVACGFLLAGASLDKLGDAAGFSNFMKECYSFTPDTLRPLGAVVIPWLEFFTGLCLIFGIRWRPAALIFCGLMAVYSIAISWDVLHGIDCTCGCFNTASEEKMTAWSVLRDLLFFGMGWIVLVSRRAYAAMDRLND